jgi:hypothetical protein
LSPTTTNQILEVNSGGLVWLYSGVRQLTLIFIRHVVSFHNFQLRNAELIQIVIESRRRAAYDILKARGRDCCSEKQTQSHNHLEVIPDTLEWGDDEDLLQKVF